MNVAAPDFAPMDATRTRKVKTDRPDARALVDACRLGASRPAPRLSDPQRHVRGLLTVRDALGRTRARDISLIRALLRQHGSRVPSGSAEAFPHRILALALPGRLLSQIAPLLAVLRHVNQQLADSDQVIEHIAAHDERVQRLRTVPSVGPVTAAAFVATIDDVQRFRHAHEGEASLIAVPTAYAAFPCEIVRPPRAWAERVYNIRRWTTIPAGGHFAAPEEPEALAEDVRAFFRELR